MLSYTVYDYINACVSVVHTIFLYDATNIYAYATYIHTCIHIAYSNVSKILGLYWKQLFIQRGLLFEEIW